MPAAEHSRSTRSGRFERQPAGYTAFVPSPLPPPDLGIDNEMLALLSKADRALGRLDGSVRTLPNPDLFVFMYVRKEAVLSSQIEGTQASIGDLLEVEANIFRPDRPDDVAEVLNYVAAMRLGLERLSELPVSERLIREIHARLMRNVRGQAARPGEIRESQNWIGPSGCRLAEATYVPPPPAELGRSLSELERFIHDDSPLPALIKIGLVHAQFESIHPFLDGNGRVGRLLITFLLCEQQILEMPILYLSFHFKRHRQRYYDLLQATRDPGDWDEWLKFFLGGIAEVSDSATETARRIVDLREEHRRMIGTRRGLDSRYGLAVLENLFSTPVVSVNQIKSLAGISYAAANNLVAAFVDMGILVEITGQARNRRFRYAPYIDLFSDL